MTRIFQKIQKTYFGAILNPSCQLFWKNGLCQLLNILIIYHRAKPFIFIFKTFPTKINVLIPSITIRLKKTIHETYFQLYFAALFDDFLESLLIF